MYIICIKDVYLYNKTKTIMKTQKFELGQKVNYSQCNSLYNGTIVEIKKDTLIVIDCESGMILWNAGYSVGSEITFNQVK